MTPQFSKVENLLTQNPKAAFEFFLLKIEDLTVPDEEVLTLLNKIILNLLELPSETSQHIFDNDLEKKQKRLISICFLRIICIKRYFLNTGDSYETSVFKLFDETLTKEFYDYPQINILIKDARFEKARKLGDCIEEKEKDLRALKDNLKDLQDIKQFKHQFSKLLGHKITKSVFSYFLPKKVTSPFEKILSTILRYIEFESRKKIETYHNVIKQCEELLDFLNEIKNPYWNRIIRSNLLLIIDITKKDFESNPISKPAKLRIETFDKKYPLSINEVTFKICLNIINEGIGSGFNIKLKITEYTHGIVILDPLEEITEINQEEIKVKLEAKITSPIDDVYLEVELSWNNANGEEIISEGAVLLEGQNVTVDWEHLKSLDPYSQEPVETETELIGRESMIKKLFVGVTKSKVSSYYIKGQRRVGKTSIVKTLRSKILNSNLPDFCAIYLECGDFKHPNSEETISTLGNKICKQIKIRDNRFSNIILPQFNGAFNPITDFFDQIEVLVPNYKVLIILDEFDQISPSLYTRTEKADSFFLTIRSISNRANIGFILVGGEQMELVISCQGEKLNKFRSIQVDYFNRQKEWSDFQDLVKKPIDDLGLTIAKGVVDKLFTYTAGNPYFTKMICETLFNEIVDRRDAYITTEEIDDALQDTLNSVTKNSFMHFWEDGIKEDASKKEEISINRRIILISFASAKKKWKNNLNEEYVVDESMKYIPNEITIRDCISEFIRRNIFSIEKQGLIIKVKFFEAWLLHKGFKSIALDYADPDQKFHQQIIDENKRVKAGELMDLVKNWESKTYRGEAIQADKIRQWLSQFDTNSKQRVAFTLLENLMFYDDYIIKGKLKEIYNQASRALEWHIQGTKKQHVLVSYLDKSVGKSGAEYAKLFASYNKIYVDNIIIPSKLPKAMNNKNIQALVFIDDIIGSGNSICTNLEELFLDDGFKEALSNNPIKIFIGVICGFQKAKEKLERKVKKLSSDIEIHICDLLDESDRCFSETSKIFPEQNKRQEAQTLSYEYGVQLESKQPLGYSNCQTLIVFPKTCPNNSLPILWKKTAYWTPLFERPSATKEK